MTNSLVQFRVNSKLKKDAMKVYDNIGIDLSTAVRIFLKKSIVSNGLPFSLNGIDILDTHTESITKQEAFDQLDNLKLVVDENLNDKENLYEALKEKYESIN